MESGGSIRGDADIQMVGQAFGSGAASAPTPNFNTKVASPAYAGAPTHPRVLFDEAHHNFHTAERPVQAVRRADHQRRLPGHPQQEKFTRDVLEKGDILVIANALGPRDGQAEASNPAFTDAECDAVRDWVKDGGSLLLITDHAPFGSAAQCLAKRFGVGMSTGTVSDPSNSEGGDRAWSSAARTTSWATTRSPGAATIPSGSTASRPSPAVAQGARGERPDPQAGRHRGRSRRCDDEKPVSAAGRAQGLAFSLRQGPGRRHGRGRRALRPGRRRGREVRDERPRHR